MVREITLVVALCATPAAAQTFKIDPSVSTTTIVVGKAGLFSFAAGHTHEVRGPVGAGAVTLDAADPARSGVELEVAASGLQVSGKGEPPDDVPKVQAAMQGEKVLDSAHYPRITFKSTSAKGARDAASLRGTGAPGQNFDVTVNGTLTIRNVSQPVTTTVHVEKTAGSLTATGRFKIKQSAFGIQPISVAGVVAVKDELDIAFSIVAKP